MGYGGALIWTGLAKNLKKQFPERDVIFVYRQSLRDLLLSRKNPDMVIYEHNPHITRVVSQWRWPFVQAHYPRERRIVVDLGDNRYQYWLNDNKEKIAYKRNAHAITIACAPFNLPEVDLKTTLILGEAEAAAVDALFSKIGLTGTNYICIEPNAKKTFTANKQWPWEHWQSLTDLLTKWIAEEKNGYAIVQVGVGGSPVLRGAIDLTGKTTFRQVKRVVEQSNLVLANEGGVAHLTASTDKKAIIISNPSLPLVLMAYPQHRTMSPKEGHHDCGLKKPCPVCHELLSSITPESVFEEVRSVLHSA